jgi:hypothetical protein
MTPRELNDKKRLFETLAEILGQVRILGEVTEDAQTIFLADTTALVFQATNDQEHAKIMFKHMLNYLKDAELIEGKVTIGKHLFDTVEISEN